MTLELDGAEFEGGSGLVVDKHDLAALTGLDLKQIDIATRDGMPTVNERARGVTNRYSVPACVQWLIARTGDTLEAARLRSLDATARKREAEAAKLEARLVDIDVVEAAIRDGVAAWRSELLSVPARVPADARAAVQFEIEAAINRLAVEVPK